MPLDRYESIASEWLKKSRPLLDVFAGDRSLKYALDPEGDAFSYHHGDHTVRIPLRWLAENQITKDQFRWMLFRELSHFTDVRHNPAAHSAKFAFIERAAREFTKKILAGEVVLKNFSEEERNGLSSSSLRRHLSTVIAQLYAAIDELYLNTTVARKAGYYSQPSGREQVRDIYLKLGGGESDFTERPLYTQLVRPLVRDEMVPDGARSVISEPVTEALRQKIWFGRTIVDILNKKLKPTLGPIDPALRYQIIGERILPTFLELLLEDLQRLLPEWPQTGEASGDDEARSETHTQEGRRSQEEEGLGEERSDEQTEGHGNEAGGVQPPEDDAAYDIDELIDEFFTRFAQQDSPLTHSPEEDEQLIEEILKKQREDEMTRAERAERDRLERQRAFDRDFSITPEVRQKFDEIAQGIKGERLQMVDFWSRLIGEYYDSALTVHTRQPRGRLNVYEFIQQYPEYREQILEGKQPKLNVYDRRAVDCEKIKVPESIEISLVIDNSGSMNGDRIHQAKLAATLLLTSVRDFNEELMRDGFSLRAITEMFVFGNDYRQIKRFSKDETSAQSMSEIIQSIVFLDAREGITENAGVLKHLLNDLTYDSKRQVDLKKGKMKKIIFEITDGEPFDIDEVKLYVNHLREQHIELVAFLVGDDTDGKVFKDVWGDNGIIIGSEVSKLPDLLIQNLQRKLSDTVTR